LAVEVWEPRVCGDETNRVPVIPEKSLKIVGFFSSEFKTLECVGKFYFKALYWE
jgi:hypothetical protein